MFTKEIITGLLITFIGTSAGSACVFFMKKGIIPTPILTAGNHNDIMTAQQVSYN